MGYLVLQGGSEFGGQMRASDLRAIELAGGRNAAVAIVPAAAAPDGNHQRAGQNGRRWFQMLGARYVTVLPLVDRQSADDSNVASALRRSRLIYLLGGFPEYLAGVLQSSAGWKAIRATLREGAVLAGSSAGAMVLGGFFSIRSVKSRRKVWDCCRPPASFPISTASGGHGSAGFKKNCPRST